VDPDGARAPWPGFDRDELARYLETAPG